MPWVRTSTFVSPTLGEHSYNLQKEMDPMKELERKAGLFKRALDNADMGSAFERLDTDNAICYRAFQNMSNGNCVILIFFDQSVFNVVSFSFAKMENIGRKEKVLALLNDLNGGYKDLKFYIDEENRIVCQFSYTSLMESFDGEMLLTMIVNSFKEIEENCYPKIMRVIWA